MYVWARWQLSPCRSTWQLPVRPQFPLACFSAETLLGPVDSWVFSWVTAAPTTVYASLSVRATSV